MLAVWLEHVLGQGEHTPADGGPGGLPPVGVGPALEPLLQLGVAKDPLDGVGDRRGIAERHDDAAVVRESA